jgi:hypothetical protein
VASPPEGARVSRMRWVASLRGLGGMSSEVNAAPVRQGMILPQPVAAAQATGRRVGYPPVGARSVRYDCGQCLGLESFDLGFRPRRFQSVANPLLP